MSLVAMYTPDEPESALATEDIQCLPSALSEASFISPLTVELIEKLGAATDSFLSIEKTWSAASHPHLKVS